jgi:NAD-dependent SIR2 family protein deacetylase
VCESTFRAIDTPERCCGARRLKSSVIDFGDSLPEADTTAAWIHTGRADVYLVVGSTLRVTPAADMPAMAADRGSALIIVNLGETALDARATVRISAKAGYVLPRIVARLGERSAATM